MAWRTTDSARRGSPSALLAIAEFVKTAALSFVATPQSPIKVFPS